MFKHFIPAEPKRDAAGRVIVVPGSTTLPFGKYKGKTFEYVFEHVEEPALDPALGD